MSIEIRKDFESAGPGLFRLVVLAETFADNDDQWSHLKNQEDFADIYQMPRPIKEAFERVYAEGRDLAGAMARDLVAFNDPRRYQRQCKTDDGHKGEKGRFDAAKVCPELCQPLLPTVARSRVDKKRDAPPIMAMARKERVMAIVLMAGLTSADVEGTKTRALVRVCFGNNPG